MPFSLRRFSLSLAAGAVGVAALVALVLSSQVAMSLMPVLGIGGFYAEIDSLEGNDGLIYPEEGSSTWPNTASIDADTPECESIPMLVLELQDGQIDRFTIRKDVELPHLEDRWMSIIIEQPYSATIQLQNIKFYTTQLRADNLLIRNIDLREGYSSFRKFGPDSGEFRLKGGQDTDSTTPGLEGNNVEVWLHGMTGETITFDSGSSSFAINLELEYPTTSELDDYYSGRLGWDEGGYFEERERYYDCTGESY